MTCYTEEIFGPVLVALNANDLDEVSLKFVLSVCIIIAQWLFYFIDNISSIAPPNRRY